MTMLLKNAEVFTPEGFKPRDLFLSDGKVFVLSAGSSETGKASRIIDCKGKVIVPGFTDVHVHLREPGFFYKESIATGTAAAARGGYTCVCPMPNVQPAPSTIEALQVQLDIIKKDARVRTVPYGTITQNQDGRSALSDMEALAPYVCAFSDDGKGVQSADLMEEAMRKAKKTGKLIVAHCEDESLLHGGYIHDGAYAAAHGHKGICSKSEWIQVQRDTELAEKTGAGYHVCHISTKESVSILREAKRRGADVSGETAPHYLVLCEDDLQEDGRFKMNPPLRSAADRDALIEGILDGTIDMIATDHAPHSAEEKAKGLAGSAFGIVGLETAFPVLYTCLVKKGILSLEKLIELMAVNPRKRFGLEGGFIADGQTADLAVLDLARRDRIDPDSFASKGRATPFAGWNVLGKTVLTIVKGEIAYEETAE